MDRNDGGPADTPCVQILVVRPRTLNAVDKALLRKSGVVCIEEGDPQSVRLLSAEAPSMAAPDMFRAAMMAIAGDKISGNTAEAFARNMAAMVKASGALTSKDQP